MHTSRHSDEQQSVDDQALTEVRTATAEVWSRVVEWRRSAGWTGDEVSQQRYAVTEGAMNELASLTVSDSDVDGMAIVAALRPILTAWRPSRPGPAQAIYVAAERLRDAVHRLAAATPGTD